MSERGVQFPPLGFLVEGDGEYQSYRSLLSRGLGFSTNNIPISNAGGCGTLVKHLEDYLQDLVRTWHPDVVVVTVDARDFRHSDEFSSCVDLKEHLQRRADFWLRESEASERFNPLPNRIVVVVQDPAFEGWLIADPGGMMSATELLSLPKCPIWENVDAEVGNPGEWLSRHLLPGIRMKDPFTPKRLAKHLSPQAMAAHSRSFRKFWKEVVICFPTSHGGIGFV